MEQSSRTPHGARLSVATNTAAEDTKETKEKEIGGGVVCVLGCVPPWTGGDRGGGGPCLLGFSTEREVQKNRGDFF